MMSRACGRGCGGECCPSKNWTALRATRQLEPACLMLAWPAGHAPHLFLPQAHVMKGITAKRSRDQ